MRTLPSLCALLSSELLIQPLKQAVKGKSLVETVEYSQESSTTFSGGTSLRDASDDRYVLSLFSYEQAFLEFVEREKHHIDCLILQDAPDLPHLLVQLQQRVLLPTLILVPAEQSAMEQTTVEHTAMLGSASDHAAMATSSPPMLAASYHSATLRLSTAQLSHLDQAIDRAIHSFLQLAVEGQTLACDIEASPLSQTSLLLQQHRLSAKLKERLGYLGVYYKRNSQNFFRAMSRVQRQELLQQLKVDYREIVLTYFSDEAGLNEKLDNFVNLVFFTNLAVAQVVEIHMELMDDISKQLKLEGRSDEVLQDYRLTLIDTIAHLCEMYRRSLPKES